MIVFFYFLAPPVLPLSSLWGVMKNFTLSSSMWTPMRERGLSRPRRRPPVTKRRVTKCASLPLGARRSPDPWCAADVSCATRTTSTMRSGASSAGTPPDAAAACGATCAADITRAAPCAGPGTLKARTPWGRTRGVWRWCVPGKGIQWSCGEEQEGEVAEEVEGEEREEDAIVYRTHCIVESEEVPPLRGKRRRRRRKKEEKRGKRRKKRRNR